MTKKRNLTTFMIAIMIMLFSLPANAEGTVGYAELKGSTLTFYGGVSMPSDAYALNTGYNRPDWSNIIGSVTKVVFDESFKDVRPTSCYQWFRVFSQLTTIEGIENLNTEKVTNMSDMFKDCSGLTSLDLSSFNTAKVESMNSMFDGCSGLTSLDLSSFNTAEVRYMNSMFDGCSGLTTIYVSDVFTIVKVSSSENMFYNCTSLKKGDVSYNPNKIDHTMANYTSGYFTKSYLKPYVKWNANTNVLTFKVANYEGNEGEWIFDEGNIAPEGIKNNCKKVVFTPSFKQVKPTSCASWFDGFSNLTTIQGIENLNTKEVTNMMYMFYGCKKLTSLDLSSFNTAKVKDMIGMFISCSSLTSLDLSKFNTAEVTGMTYMFGNCSSLTSLDLSSFNTAKVTEMYYMFNGCSGLTTIYVSDDFTIGNGCSGDNMFSSCSNLKGATPWDITKTGIEMANFDGYFTPKTITPYVKWDASTKVLTFKVANNKEEGAYDLNEGAKDPGWSIDDVKNNCTKVVFTPSFKQAKPTSCYRWFLGFSKPTTIEGIENLNTEKVTNMSEMFNSCSGLTSLDLSSFNTAKVTNMNGMFGGCDDLISLDLSSFNTAEVTDMTWMFYNCQSLTTIYVSDDFTKGNVRSSDKMFQSCFGLEGATSYDSFYTGIEMANYKTGYFKTYFTYGEKKVELCGNPLTTKILDLSGDYDFTPKYEFKAKSVNYIRDLSSSGSTWFSLCLPFAYTPNNFTAYQLKGATGDAVEIEQITGAIAAGTPVLFKFNGEDKKIDINITATDDDKIQIVKAPVEGATVNGTDGSSLQLCGTYQNKSFSEEDGNAFILLNDKLMNPAKMLENKKVTKVGVKPFRAYMTLTASAPAQLASARAFSIGRGGEGNEGTTAIDLLNSVATDDAEYYDINGRRIDAPVKGVNIVRRGNKTIKLIIK